MQRGVVEATEHGVAHTIFVLEIDYHAFQWQITRLPPNYAKRCWAVHANTWTMCNVKVGYGKTPS